MQGKLGTVGIEFISTINTPINFFSKVYLLDFDYIIVRLGAIEGEIRGLKGGGSVATSEEYNYFERIINYRSIDLKKYYEHGGVIILIVDVNPILTSRVGGMGNTTTDILKFFSNNFVNIAYLSQSGNDYKHVESLSSIINLIDINFQCLIKAENYNPLIWTSKTKDALTFNIEIDKGLLLALPNFSLKPIDPSLNKAQQKEFVDCLVNFCETLKYNQNIDFSKAPAWIGQFTIGKEAVITEKMNNLISKKAELEISIDKQQEALNKYLNIKSLIYLDGLDLERQVADCLKSFGFEAIVPIGSNDDLNIKFEDFVGVVEVKGVAGSAAKKFVRQVENWVTDYALKNEDREAKGILIINTYKNLPLGERINIDFPPDVIEFSEKRSHCLMLTIDLINIKIDFDEELISIEEITSIFNTTNGKISYKPRFKKK